MSVQQFVSERFDQLQHRFKASVSPGDVRLTGVGRALGPIAGKRLLDLGCGKGRFARHWISCGASVVGLDLSAGMLVQGFEFPRVKGSAVRLPFATNSFECVVAIEVLEHIESTLVHTFLSEANRVLVPGGCLVIVDKNATALDSNRPWLPAVLVKRIEERQGRWMYRAGEPFRERWFNPSKLSGMLRNNFHDVSCEYLLRPEEERHIVFRHLPAARLWTLWHGTKRGAIS